MAEAVLYHWPASAAFGRNVPKAKFYEHGDVRASVRAKFIDDVQRITWSYKLSDDTLRLRGSDTVPEIQVFTIEAKGEDVPNAVLTAIDKAVHFPIIFEIVSAGRIRIVGAQKTLSGTTPRIATYFSTDWQPADAPRQPLPPALDLPTLHEAILVSLLPIPARAGETVSQAADRLDQVRKLQREIAALEKTLRTEPQFNRKVDLRRRLKERQAAVTALIDIISSSKD